MAPESERAKTCKWCDKPIHKVRRYNSAGNEYFEQWAHELDDDATCTIMVEPNEPTLTCSEVVERLPMSAREFRLKQYFLPSSLDTYPKAEEFAEAYAKAILHSWRERRVQELEEALREQIEKIKQSADYHEAQFHLNKSMYSQGIADGLYDALAIIEESGKDSDEKSAINEVK